MAEKKCSGVQFGISVCLDFFGESGPECFTEGSVVYINRDPGGGAAADSKSNRDDGGPR